MREIPLLSARTACDAGANQLVVPINPNNGLAFVKLDWALALRFAHSNRLSRSHAKIARRSLGRSLSNLAEVLKRFGRLIVLYIVQARYGGRGLNMLSSRLLRC